jgi:hypothetical protein
LELCNSRYDLFTQLLFVCLDLLNCLNDVIASYKLVLMV